ncbi:MAG: pitrilysin family protein [Bacilli bacterium]|jgi:predicted Zn-dependent peptidase|nr:pitrilysin family protein [Bacilli bacterium]
MKKINLKGLDLVAYTETLSNGLDVIFVPFEKKSNYYISYATRFGSEITSFTPAGEKKSIKVPDGIAHFLEHKMFEQESGEDPFAYFSKSGTGANASTSYDNTQYICYGTKNFIDNLRYLIQYVNAPYYTDENVEKEKGIIAEELKMYADLPDVQLETKLRENVYHVHPRRVDIGGTVDEIYKITKEDLYLCYNNFYSPNNMFILVVGKFPMEEAMSVIHQELDTRENLEKAEIATIKEKKSVRKKEDSFVGNIQVPKIAVGLKVPIADLGEYEDLELDLYLTMFTTMLFGSSSLFRERARNEKLLNNFYSDWDNTEQYKTYMILSSTNHPESLVQEIKKELSNHELDEAMFERMKKVWIANEVKMADYIDSTVNNVFDDMIRYHKVIPNKVDMIRKMNMKTLEKIVSKIDFDNLSVVIMNAQEEVL